MHQIPHLLRAGTKIDGYAPAFEQQDQHRQPSADHYSLHPCAHHRPGTPSRSLGCRRDSLSCHPSLRPTAHYFLKKQSCHTVPDFAGLAVSGNLHHQGIDYSHNNLASECGRLLIISSRFDRPLWSRRSSEERGQIEYSEAVESHLLHYCTVKVDHLNNRPKGKRKLQEWRKTWPHLPVTPVPFPPDSLQYSALCIRKRGMVGQ